MTMKVLRHRLQQEDGTPYPFRRSPNQSGPITPEYLVMHYTAGHSAESSVAWLTDPAAQASAHLVIGRDGGVTQLVGFNRKAWHAGASRWVGREGVNTFSIGIELDNPGLLVRRADGWRTEWGDPVEDGDVIEAAHKNGGPVRGWHAYATGQIEVAVEVATVLARRYGLKDVIGHDDVAPGRKSDPGPAFPMSLLRERAMGHADDAPETMETTAALNIRAGPGTEYDKLPQSPLPPATRVEELAAEGVWRRVDVLDTIGDDMDLQGWVHGRYLRPRP